MLPDLRCQLFTQKFNKLSIDVQCHTPSHDGSRTKPLSDPNPPPAKTRAPPAKTPLLQKPPSGQNPSPTKIPLRPKTTADKNSPPGERVRLHVVITKNNRLLLLLNQNVIVLLT